MCSRFFCIPTWRIQDAKERCNMQSTTTIEAQGVQRTGVDLTVSEVKDRVMNQVAAINGWLDRKSEFYSRIADFAVTNRTVVRVNAVTACVIVGALVIEAAPVASLLSAACAAWMVRRLNRSEKSNTIEEKGGVL